MAKLIINNTSESMELHIQKAYDIIDKHLPFHYTDLVLAKLPTNSGITSGIVRNVKKKLSKRIDVLNAMVEVALDNKKLEENFKELTT
jgi:hypothetical protein